LRNSKYIDGSIEWHFHSINKLERRRSERR